MTALNKQALRKLAKALSGKEWVAFVHKASGTYAVGSLGHERGEDIIKWPGLDGQDNAESKAKFIAAANPATVLALLDELEAAEKRIAELTGKPAEEYADDDELLFEIDFCDDLSTSIQVAQWLKELRIRRAAGIGVNGELQGGKCE
ncbi:ead/Ea22-like family protein [Citrobacter braakii]|uniref:Ead/Ea22-like family protein n=1 Tax=Citrobacter braakii TaxID=57706 RepID=A0A8I0G8H5_CITBR|nr:ead/Ea22-like family protein [Citrobacter braakii]MBD3125354.1 ead/Ea22-like family protein [Citrobacter braakii]